MRPTSKKIAIGTGIVTILALAVLGCATIMQGTQQSVGIGSTPTGATVLVDGKSVGTAPLVTKLSRKDHHVVRLELTGYKPYETTLTRSVSGWVWGNIVFGGLIGLVVDAMTGGLYKLSPAEIQAELKAEGVSVRVERDGVYFAVVMHREPSWEKVGQLERR